jgi:hypothetical protein
MATLFKCNKCGCTRDHEGKHHVSDCSGTYLQVPAERIAQAAILHDGIVYTGRRHCLIIQDIVQKTGIKRVIGKQGFTTDTGRFVDREEAGRIAIAAGQIKELRYHREQLFSEEIIP